MQNAFGNPLYHWTHLELQRYFDIKTPLNPDTALDIWNECNEKLKQKKYSVRNLLQMQNVEVLCTTDDPVVKILQEDGVEELEPVITSKNTYVAPFVNAEESEYLVIEDVFPNGRPKLEKGGLMFTTRETVDKVEKMKVCTCLNPLHTAHSHRYFPEAGDSFW